MRDAVDWANLIDEVENLGKSERSALGFQMERILVHLLKWKFQPQRRSYSWLDSINDGRSQSRRGWNFLQTAPTVTSPKNN